MAAAVVLPASCFALVKGRLWPALGVRVDDSKRLTARQRERAYKVILRRAAVGVGIVPADAIDTDNILQATLCAMAQAVADLPLLPDMVLVDGLQTPSLALPCWPFVNGDQLSGSIACASIVAKVVRDSLMAFYHRLFPAYQFDRHKGYGTEIHAQALAQWGACALHRMTFAPVSETCRLAAERAIQAAAASPPAGEVCDAVAA